MSKSELKAKDELGRVLVVEDEEHIRDLIALHLRREGLEVDVAADAETAWRLLRAEKFALVALDWMLPGASGIDIAKRLRRETDFGDVGILMITARAEANDIVDGLEAGADDYLTKPFEPAVLIARVRALLRRNRRSGPPELEGNLQLVRIGKLKLYPETFECKSPEGPIQLTPSEFKLMIALANSGGRVLTRDSLINQIQGEGVAVVGRTVDTHVFGLRKKLGEYADVIDTVRGIGYRVKPS